MGSFFSKEPENVKSLLINLEKEFQAIINSRKREINTNTRKKGEISGKSPVDSRRRKQFQDYIDECAADILIVEGYILDIRRNMNISDVNKLLELYNSYSGKLTSLYTSRETQEVGRITLQKDLNQTLNLAKIPEDEVYDSILKDLPDPPNHEIIYYTGIRPLEPEAL